MWCSCFEVTPVVRLRNQPGSLLSFHNVDQYPDEEHQESPVSGTRQLIRPQLRPIVYLFSFLGQDCTGSFPISPDLILNTLWESRTAGTSPSDNLHPTVHLALRFACDGELDHTLAPHSTRLQSRLCAKILQVPKNSLTIAWKSETAEGPGSSLMKT